MSGKISAQRYNILFPERTLKKLYIVCVGNPRHVILVHCTAKRFTNTW